MHLAFANNELERGTNVRQRQHPFLGTAKGIRLLQSLDTPAMLSEVIITRRLKIQTSKPACNLSLLGSKLGTVRRRESLIIRVKAAALGRKISCKLRRPCVSQHEVEKEASRCSVMSYYTASVLSCPDGATSVDLAASRIVPGLCFLTRSRLQSSWQSLL